MAEKRKFSKVFCVKNNAKTSYKIEVFPAEQWENGVVGQYRLRINRKWSEPPEANSYYTQAMIFEILQNLSFGSCQTLADAPNLPCGSRVKVTTEKIATDLGEVRMCACTFTSTPPIRGYDGNFYVGVLLLGKGVAFVPVEDIEIIRLKK